MSLTFLVPLFLLGLAGIAVPVILHLTRKQRKNVVAFPSLMFLEKIPFQEQRRRRIQNWFLLLVRALALALLALAFSRPFVDDAEVSGTAAGGPREVVLLLDRSYSMERGSSFADGVEAARAELSELGPLDRISLVAFDQGAVVVARSTADPTRLRTALDTLAPGSGTTRYGPALKAAQTILEESELPLGEVVLLTDFQRHGWTGDEGVRLPPGTVLTRVDVAAAPTENVQVADLTLTRSVVSGRERRTASVRLLRRSGQAEAVIPVTLELDGQELQTREVTLPADGPATVTFEPFTLSAPHTSGAVRVPADDLPTDDARHFALSPGDALDVLVIEGGTAGLDESLYLMRALDISEEGRFRARTAGRSALREDVLSDTEVVVLHGVPLDGASAEVLRGFVADGGGLLVAPGEGGSWPASSADLLPGSLGTAEDRSAEVGGRLGFLDYDHPVFEAFAGPRRGDFTGARFFRARTFTAGDSARILARFDDGSPALVESGVGRGTILVWTSTLDSYWNDLALQPVYLPFVHRLVEHLAGRPDALPWFTVGQVVDLADGEALERAGLSDAGAARLSGDGDLVAMTPSGGSLPLAGGDGPRYLTLEERGFYEVRPPGSDPDRPFILAVNPDLEESAVAALDAEQLAAAVTAPPGSSGSTGTSFEGAELRREDQERRQSLWRWLLLGAFGLLVAETVASNWLSRRRSGTPGLARG